MLELINHENVSVPIEVGDNSRIINSILEEDVHINDYNIFQNCVFENGVTMGDHTSLVGCIFYSSGGISALTGDNIPQSTRFTKEVGDKAWLLIEEQMSSEQYFAFMEGSTIELKNITGNYRLLLEKSGVFVILQGDVGKGIVATRGRIQETDYPLGDEITAFLDWFKYKTDELIAQWHCGTYSIKKEGERR